MHEQPSSGMSGNNSEDTFVPVIDKDPPMTLEEALDFVSEDIDKYSLRNLYVVSNALSMVGFTLFLSTIFLFASPKLECYNHDIELYYRCSLA
jgi:hypothetical protein